LENNVTIVTEPTYYHNSQLSLMLYDVPQSDVNIIAEMILNSGIGISLHIGCSDNNQEWLLNTARQTDFVVLNLDIENLIKGFVLSFSNVRYYNAKNTLETLNTNEIRDPIDFVMRLINERQ